LASIRAPGHGKMFPSGDARTVFLEDILNSLRTTEIGEALVVVGPGFTREAFVEFLKARDPALAAKVHVHGTAHAGMQGIQEALKAGVGARCSARAASDTRRRSSRNCWRRSRRTVPTPTARARCRRRRMPGRSRPSWW